MSTHNNNTKDIDFSTTLIPLIVQFWLYLPFLIPSILCTLLLLCFLLFDQNLRRALNNHVIIVLLCTGLFSQLTIFPWMFHYFLQTDIWIRSPIFCDIWGYIDMTVYYMQLLLFAWASFERHILIFHDRWLATQRQRFFLHYLPVILIIIYCLIFYAVPYFFPLCENSFDYSVALCTSLCLYNFSAFQTMDAVVNNILPNFLIIILSVALLVRTWRQKRRMRQTFQWRKHRKMTIQLLSISLLYLFATSPYAMMVLLRLCGLPADQGVEFQEYTIFVSYYAELLFPFDVMFSVPEFLTKVKDILRLRRQRGRIAPTMLPMNDMRRTAIANRTIHN